MAAVVTVRKSGELWRLSRKPEDRTVPPPQPADLRESGSIDEDADLVAFIDPDDVDDRQSPTRRGRDRRRQAPQRIDVRGLQTAAVVGVPTYPGGPRQPAPVVRRMKATSSGS